jgi:ADP-heptose:LPS heptosyltransferase
MSNKQKILLIRFSAIGDIVLTSPVIRCLKKQLDVELHYLTKEKFKPVLIGNPYIDKIHTIDKNVSEVIPDLKKEKYDLIVDLHKNLRTAQVKWQLFKRNITFDKINLQKWLMVNFKIDLLPKLHIVDRYMQGLCQLGVDDDGEGLDYFIPDDDEVNVNSLSGTIQDGFASAVIGGNYFTKKMPEDKWVSICNQLSFPVVLLGGPEDRELANRIEQKTRGTVFNACGKFNINQSASIVSQSKFVLTHDTGLMHIAAAFKKPVFSFWGNTIPEFGMYPFYGSKYQHNVKNMTFEVKNLKCRPCSKIGYNQCPKKHFNCMQMVDTKLVVHDILQ